jgi:triosephosphate isomerase (TIM)
MRKPLLAGNWKMYKTIAETRTLANTLRSKLNGLSDRDVLICPPFTAVSAAAQELQGSTLFWGGQNAHWEREGAFTGDISAHMLADLGCKYAIVGHSERRQLFGETDAMINKRMHGALAAGLTPIVCIGETLAEREAGKTFAVLERQIKESLAGLSPSASIVIAYEPVWAIGTGKTATPAQAQEAHAYVRKQFEGLYGESSAKAVRILYGGSVKPDNAKTLMEQPDIDGALVGGASLDADSFSKIVRYNLS